MMGPAVITVHHINPTNHGSRQLQSTKIIRRITVQDRKRGVMEDRYAHSELTGKIIGCAMAVHKTLGNGFQEVIYQRALAIEMAHAGLNFTREHEMEIFYRGESIGTRRVDFFVEGIVMVE